MTQIGMYAVWLRRRICGDGHMHVGIYARELRGVRRKGKGDGDIGLFLRVLHGGVEYDSHG